MASFSRTVARNSAFGFAAQLATKIASFAFNILVVRQLGPELFGQYSAINAFGATFIFIADLGLSIYAIRQIATHRDDTDAVLIQRAAQFNGNLLALRLVLSLIASVVMLTFASLTGRPSTMMIGLALVAVSWVLYAFQGSYAAMLGGYERLDLSSRAQIIYQVLFVVLGAIVVLGFSLGYVALIVANVISIALLTFLCWRGIRTLNIKIGRPDPKQWLGIIRACIPFGIVTLALGLSYKFDSVLLNVTRSDAETGYYGAAYNLIFSAVVFSNVLNTSLFPSLTRQAASAPSELPRIYERAMRYLLLVSIPIAVAVWALSDQLVPFLFKAQFAPAVDALRILIWVVPFMYVSEFLGYVVLISGNEKKVARSVGISTIINIGLNLFLVPRFGYVMAAAMTVLTEMVLVGQYVWLLRKPLSQMNWNATLFRPLLAAVLMGGALLLVRGSVPWFISAGVGAALYIVLLLVLGVVGKDELRFVQNLRRKEAPAV